MTKKSFTVWLFSSLTFISTAHLIDALLAVTTGTNAKILQLYPLINEKLQTLAPATYFWITAAATLIFWGITCTIAFDNPVETFLNKILSDAKQQTAVETQLLENKSELLDMMFETIEADNKILSQVKDLMCNVRADAKEIQPPQRQHRQNENRTNQPKKRTQTNRRKSLRTQPMPRMRKTPNA
ncbi:MAG: hypothetical protein QHH24_07360 [Candidatus Bathyarchaeota archaeon]|nr:hypothetical protein [Candidatus Bathyarchaeota archaeon]